jgi:uncharacterized membrane protein
LADQAKGKKAESMFLGLAISDWMIWVVMILFILVYFVVTERMNRNEEAAEERMNRNEEAAEERSEG